MYYLSLAFITYVMIICCLLADYLLFLALVSCVFGIYTMYYCAISKLSIASFDTINPYKQGQ